MNIDIKYKISLEDGDKNQLQEYCSQITNIYKLVECGLDFDEIDKVQNELKSMPRPIMSKQQYNRCEMRLQDKWRRYLSATFPEEYINPVQNLSNDYITEMSDTQELLNHQESSPDDEDSKMPELKMIRDMMNTPVTSGRIDNNNNEEMDALDIENKNGAFIRSKHKHRRSSNSFMKAPSFLDNLNPFWSIQYDSGNELESSDDIDHSRNSNSSAIVHKEEHDNEDHVDNDHHVNHQQENDNMNDDI